MTRRLIPISAIWVQDRIQKEKKVRLKNAQINGDIDLSKPDLPTKSVARTEFQKYNLDLSTECKIISSEINISESEFRDRVQFSNCFFDKQTWFSRVTFSRYASFNGATFSRYAGFDGLILRRFAWRQPK